MYIKTFSREGELISGSTGNLKPTRPDDPIDGP